jgi:hypothetical protein
MKSLGLFGLIVITSLAAIAADTGSATGGPPVLRKLEPDDSVVFQLPGPSPAPRKIKRVVPIPPVAKQSPLPAKLDLKLPQLPEAPAEIRPPEIRAVANSPARPVLPESMEREVALYCQQFIGRWKAADARGLLGSPLRSRPAYDENKSANGRIYAFHDPTGRYKEMELDFDGKTGALRTVFVYPLHLTWRDVHRQWTGEVSAADAREGRKFYSYVNRRLDVLVDAGGRVISLGLY